MTLGYRTSVLTPATRDKVAARFASKAERQGECLVWTAAQDRRQWGHYGVMRVGAVTVRAHRLAYELAHGAVPEALEIDHLCRNTLCVRPEHLQAVTRDINNIRSTSRSALNAEKWQCKNGHQDWAVNNRGHRFCKTCARIIDKRRRTRLQGQNEGASAT